MTPTYPYTPQYLSLAQAKALIAQYIATYDDASAGVQGTNDDWILQDIESCEGTVNGYVSVRYIVPVTTPANAVAICRDITSKLFSIAAMRRRAVGEVPVAFTAGEKRAYEQLQAIANGTAKLAAPGAQQTDGFEAMIEGTSAAVPIMTRTKLFGI